jgi:4-carboxymuconolactone decarboxylase
MRDDSLMAAALEVRRQVMGDGFVDKVLGEGTSGTAIFQEYVTLNAWSLWTRDVLARRERSIITLGMTAASGCMDAFERHAAGARRTGLLSDAELDEVVLHILAYCGAPIGVAAHDSLRTVRRQAAEASNAAPHTRSAHDND